MKDLSGIVAKFKVQGTVEEIKPLGTGLINDTYKVNTKEVDAPDYVLQRINHAIFQNVEMLQSNIAAVTGHIRKKLTEAGAKRVLPLKVGGAFHAPLMEPARQELETAIKNTRFSTPVCPIYQNVDAQPYTDPAKIQENLIAQLTASVRWTQIMKNMIADGATSFLEIGPGKVLQGLLKKVSTEIETNGIQ